jgi:hypothetical protein
MSKSAKTALAYALCSVLAVALAVVQFINMNVLLGLVALAIAVLLLVLAGTQLGSKR